MEPGETAAVAHSGMTAPGNTAAQPSRPFVPGMATVDALDACDTVIDARSPAEYAEDHVPGAINLPVLDDVERTRIGTLYSQESPFAAKKAGAALIARHIADYLEGHFADKPKTYRPLVYCWRGGNRSGAMVTILRAIGWNAAQLEGGYKAYRQRVLDDLTALPGRFAFRVVSGPTGSGKSDLLAALARHGAQVLDLEALAAHKGSVLGPDPGCPQPNQKRFETRIWDALRHFDAAQPVFVEAESKRIGRLSVPEALIARMHASPSLWLDTTLPVRVTLLRRAYAHFMADPEALCEPLERLVELRGRERVSHWQTLARNGDWDELVESLLATHYDPAYRRSLEDHYPPALRRAMLTVADAGAGTMDALARQILAE